MADEQTETQVTRLTVNLAPTVAAALRLYAAEHRISYTEAIRHAISLLHLTSEERRRGNRILVEDRDTRNQREIVLQ